MEDTGRLKRHIYTEKESVNKKWRKISKGLATRSVDKIQYIR